MNNPELCTINIILMIFLYSNAFVNGVPSCNKYTLNTYLYIVLGILTLFSSLKTIDKRKIKVNASTLSIILMISSLIAVVQTNPEKVLLNHAFWFTFLTSLAYNVYPLIKNSKHKLLIMNTLVLVMLSVFSMTTLIQINPDLVDVSIKNTILITIITGILSELLNKYMLKQNNSLKMTTYIYSVIFSITLLFDTKRIKQNSKSCKSTPDYPKASLKALFPF